MLTSLLLVIWAGIFPLHAVRNKQCWILTILNQINLNLSSCTQVSIKQTRTAKSKLKKSEL